MKRRQGVVLPKTDSVPETLSVAEVCEALGMSRATLYRRRYRYTQEGGRRRYYVSDIRLMLALNTTQAWEYANGP